VFTYRVFVVGADGAMRQCSPTESHIPFVTWEIQDEHIKLIEKAISEGFDLLTDKSRDMGATWDHITLIHHQWLFRADRTFLEISRKEDSVDVLGAKGGASDIGTLFGKHDYINQWLPSWMAPVQNRKRLHLLNLVNRSRIDGESANATAGSSDRRTAILLDEMAKMENGESIKRSTRDVTACRLANSTPNGAGTAFSNWRTSGQVRVFVLPWWEHPEKGVGRYAEQDAQTNKWKILSPWYLVEASIRTPKEMAIEIDMDHIGSGDTFFEGQNVEVHRRLYARDPLSTLKVDFRPGVPTNLVPKLIRQRQQEYIQVRKVGKGPLRLWTNLIHGRLDQTKTYIVGGDISRGQGASNSVLSILCAETRVKVGEWADANTPPYEFARIACALAIWIGGKTKRPLLIWEANGTPGWDFGRQIVRIYKYPSYYIDHTTGVISEKTGKKYGWNSSREKKSEALGIYRRAIAHGGIINHSHEALDEMLTYVHYAGGGIGPACLLEESAEAKKCHGDRVIADMLCLWALEGKAFMRKKPKESAPPVRSPAHRRKAAMKRRNQSTSPITQCRFDHRRAL